ncbi:MAG: PASTA domain-containing protein [Thermodesulfobacteriota bacterium]
MPAYIVRGLIGLATALALLAAPVAAGAAGQAALVRVPNLVGKTPAQAGQQASAAGLTFSPRPAGRQSAPAAVQLERRVQRQSPAAGRMVPRRTTVVGYVRASARVPRLQGLHLQQALKVLGQCGFRHRIQTSRYWGNAPLVRGQMPPPGLRLALDGVVSLEVSRVGRPGGPLQLTPEQAGASARPSAGDLQREAVTPRPVPR